MDGQGVADQGGLVPASGRGVTIRSSQLARRGLELVGACCDEEIRDAVLTYRKGTGVKELSFFRRQVADACLEHLADLTTLEWLELYRTESTDAGMVHLAGLTRLRYLDLSHNRTLTDAGVAHLAGLTGLEELHLKGTNVTDIGLASLRGLTGLTKLDLFGTRVGPTGVAHLRGLTALEDLSLPFNVKDASLPGAIPHLQKLPRLKDLSFPAWASFDEGPPDEDAERRWEMIKRALPECVVGLRLI